MLGIDLVGQTFLSAVESASGGILNLVGQTFLSAIGSASGGILATRADANPFGGQECPHSRIRNRQECLLHQITDKNVCSAEILNKPGELPHPWQGGLRALPSKSRCEAL